MYGKRKDNRKEGPFVVNWQDGIRQVVIWSEGNRDADVSIIVSECIGC